MIGVGFLFQDLFRFLQEGEEQGLMLLEEHALGTGGVLDLCVFQQPVAGIFQNIYDLIRIVLDKQITARVKERPSALDGALTVK